MERTLYREKLAELQSIFESTPNTRLLAFHKVATLVVLNMRAENVSFTRDLPDHPYLLTRRNLEDAITTMLAARETAFIEAADRGFAAAKPAEMEVKHQELFNEIWTEYQDQHMRAYVERYVHRLRVNELGPLIAGKRVIDLGCGNGVFCFALAREGVGQAVGIDYGTDCIRHAQMLQQHLSGGERCLFQTATDYQLPFADASFDFAIQNGVFHHLDHLDQALTEAARVLKPGAWFWYYTEGAGGIYRDLLAVSVKLLRDVPSTFVREVLRTMNVSPNKTAHLMDALNATYVPTTWDEITARLGRHGFGNFRRLVGGTPTDMDHDRIAADPYGREKFGEGDLRLLCQKLPH